ncbi:MAG TPA: FAD-dependent oxidoreductase, partial [Polyangiaceae bacterium]
MNSQIQRRDILKLFGLSLAGLATEAIPSEALAGAPVVSRDVAIIGGGSAGVYTAFRLRDMGKSVAVIERSNRLGGHAQTFRDPTTGTPIDIGVVVFPDLTLVRNYFGRFDVPLIPVPPSSGGSSFSVDFRSGLVVDAYAPSPNELGQALLSYLQLLTTRYAFLEANGYQLPTSGPILEELLLPFRRFAQQNGLNALLPLFFLYEQGFAPLLHVTSLYVLKNLGPSVIASILSGSFLTVPTGVGSLYDAATVALDGDCLLQARVLAVIRCGRSSVHALIDTPQGLRILECRKLVITAPPLLHNFTGFDIDASERDVFSRFRPNYYWTAVVRVTGLPPQVTLVNAAPNTFENLAPMPGLYAV